MDFIGPSEVVVGLILAGGIRGIAGGPCSHNDNYIPS